MNKEELKTLAIKWDNLPTRKGSKARTIATETITKLNRLYVCIGGKE